MSSLAGALEPQNSSWSPDRRFPPKEEDVEMQPPEDDEQHQSSTPAPQEDAGIDDLFGQDDDEVENGRRTDGEDGSEADGRLPSPELERRRLLEYEENDDNVGDAVHQIKEADVEFPNIPVPKSSSGDNWVIRMPNFVKVDSRPFHQDTYMGPEHDDEDTHADSLREKSMSIKLKVENTLRWRWIVDSRGDDVRQSNSRIIRWSDGTLSLRLGKELFDINQSIDTSGAVARQTLGAPAGPSSSTPTPVKSQGLTYLVAQHKRAQVLQSEAVVTGYMTLRPTGMQSETHRMLVRAVGQKHNKVARLRMAPDPTMDPEREKAELVKQSMKKPKRKSALDVGGGEMSGRKKRGGVSRKRSGHDVWSDDDDDEPAFDGSDEEEERTSRSQKRKKSGEDKKDEAGDYQEDGFVINDEDSDEDVGGSSKRRKKRREESEGEEEEDPLDKMDAAISQRQEQERQNRKSRGDTSDAEMDVESEEEEEEHKVRRAGRTSSRKKRAMDFDDDDDE